MVETHVETRVHFHLSRARSTQRRTIEPDRVPARQRAFKKKAPSFSALFESLTLFKLEVSFNVIVHCYNVDDRIHALSPPVILFIKDRTTEQTYPNGTRTAQIRYFSFQDNRTNIPKRDGRLRSELTQHPQTVTPTNLPDPPPTQTLTRQRYFS